MNWSISVVFLFNVVRKSSFCAASRDSVIIGRLSYGCVDRGRVVLSSFGVVIGGSLGVAAGNRVVFRKIGAITR